MKIKSVSIKNFRGINGDEALVFDCDNFNVLIGNNGTSKTAILEAINLCLSSNYAASRLRIDDFYLGGDEEIEIKVFFDEDINVSIPDLFGNAQIIECNGICLTAKKRDKSASGKAFNDLVVVTHSYIPILPRGEDGWIITRRSGTPFKITERQLALSYSSASTPNPFYFGKDRGRQLKKGYNSSMANIIDDLNWRFEKGQRGKDETEKFKHKKDEFEKYITENTDGDTLKKTIEATNSKLEELEIPPIDLSLIKTLSPYDNSEMVKRFDGFELPVSLIGSGIEMIVALIFLETLARISRNKICIIIDEPELHLHPTLQTKLSNHFATISEDCQIFISTHSPFFFKNCFSLSGTKMLISEVNADGKVSVNNAQDKGFGLLKWSPSWGEVCYLAYNLPTIEFHDDLYSSLQDKNNLPSLAAVDAWLLSKGQTKEIKWTHPTRGLVEETLMTCIRNRIHHSENQHRPMYTSAQLEDSINRMITLLRV